MLKEVQLAGSVRTPFGSFCGAFADVSAVELGKAAVERSGLKPEDVKEILVGTFFPAPSAQSLSARAGRGFTGGGMGIEMALELTSTHTNLFSLM